MALRLKTVWRRYAGKVLTAGLPVNKSLLQLNPAKRSAGLAGGQSGHKTRDQVRQACHFRFGQDHQFSLNLEFIPVLEAIAVDVHGIDPQHPIG